MAMAISPDSVAIYYVFPVYGRRSFPIMGHAMAACQIVDTIAATPLRRRAQAIAPAALCWLRHVIVYGWGQDYMSPWRKRCRGRSLR